MSTDYDIITVGGGLGGAALAKAMAEKGYRVLVLERETKFKDRVRGEQMAAWGAGDARDLGIYDLLVSSCANEMGFWNVYAGPMLLQHRDLAATCPQGLPNLTFYHPEMQETLLLEAAAAGADVQRGVRVTELQPGTPPSVTFADNGRTETMWARLVAACDGRNSPSRKAGDFTVKEDTDRLQIAGLLFDEMDVPQDTAHIAIDLSNQRWVLFFPQGKGRVRTYITSRTDGDARFQGEKDIARYIEEASRICGDPKPFAGARPNGPLATFNGADSWADHPYANGVALVGDAAATSDPSFGQGLSLTTRDVRVLRDKLLADDDWDSAGHAYAEEHDEYYQEIRTCEDWFTQLFYDRGPDADTRRGRALALVGQDPSRVPDTLQSGPGCATLDETAKRRFFGED